MKKFTQHVKMSFTKRKLTGLIFENVDMKPKKIFQKKMDELNINSRAKKNNNKRLLSATNKSENELIKDRDIMKKDKISYLNSKKKYLTKNLK